MSGAPMASGPDGTPMDDGHVDLAGVDLSVLIHPDPARIFKVALAEFDRRLPPPPVNDDEGR